MTRLSRLSPWYWVMLAALVIALVLYVANFVLGWGLAWLSLVLVLVSLVSNVYIFRQLWKQTDHRAFHKPEPDSDAKSTSK